MTHRQFMAWQDWLERQWDMPDRHDNYIMMLTAVVEGLFSKSPVEPRKLKFEHKIPKPSTKGLSLREQEINISKQRSLKAAGLL